MASSSTENTAAGSALPLANTAKLSFMPGLRTEPGAQTDDFSLKIDPSFRRGRFDVYL